MENKYGTEGLTKEEMNRLMNLSECAMFTARKDPEISIQYANKKFYDMLQYTPEQFQEQYQGHLMDVIIPEEKQKVRNLIARQAAAGGLLNLEFRVKKRDGSLRWISMTAQTVAARDDVWYYCSCIDITQQKRSLEEIYSAKKEAEMITNSVPGGVIKLKTSDYSILYANDGFFRLAGYSRMEYRSLFGNQCSKVLYPEDAPLVKRMIQSAVENRGVLGFEYRIVAKNGEIRWSYVNGCRVDDLEGEAVYLCIIMDITAKKKLEGRLEDNARRSRNLLQFMKETEWTYQIPEKKVYRSGYLEGTYSSEEEIEGLFERERLCEFVHPDDVERLLEELSARVEEFGHSKGVYRIRDGKGDYRSNSISMISVASDGSEKPNVIYGETMLVEDNSYMLEQQGQESGSMTRTMRQNRVLSIAKTAQAKNEDDVTELMPYHEFLDAVAEQLKQRKEKEKYGLLCCDVNGFQKLTYHYGVSIGDEILRRLSGVLKKHMSYKSLCSRVNGDYFVVFFQYTHHGELLKKISHMLQIQTNLEEKQSYSTNGTTSGIYLIDPEDSDVLAMLGKADLARRSIKGTRGNHFAIYTDELENGRFWEEEIVQDIENSILQHTIEICYLPRIQGTKENVIGSKAVPRVPLKDGNFLSLEDLQRYVERSETVQQLVFYVLTAVCGNLSAWKAKGKKITPVSIDITAGQLCMQNAVAKIDQIVRDNHLEPTDIIFEIQEHFFAELTAKLEMALKELTQKGYRVIISRFASDHTAIHSLRRLPVSGIKFHGEYFRQNIKNEKEHIIFSKIVEMAKELDMKVGCGGIQTQLQEEIARSIGCDILEGDIFYGAVRSDVYEKCFLTVEDSCIIQENV